MVAFALKQKAVASSNSSSDDEQAEAATTPVAPVEKKKAPTKTKKADAPTVLKKRRAASQAPPPVQKNTLDRWFGVAKKPTKAVEKVIESNDATSEEMEVEASPVVQRPREKTAKAASPSKPKQKSKKLLQRRILLGDQCRVCDSAKTETSTRCERKCMGCEMTVHMSCYGVEDDDEMLPEKWRCRPCQTTYDLTVETPEADENDNEEDGSESTPERGIPAHEPRGEDGAYNGLYNCSDFAAVFLFLKRFRRLGLKLGADITISTLASALLAPREHPLLYELHTKLLQNVGATLSKNQNWMENLIGFLKASDYPIGGELVRRLAACGNANDWLSTYYDVSVTDRAALLKVLCEAQFDENDTLVEKIGHNDTSPESLREETLGVDASKRSYYLLEDPANFPDGSAWLCRCHSHDGSQWETVSDDLASLQSFVRALSFSNETADLQLWQTIAHGVAKSLERREKKKAQQAQRRARVPRMLRSTGLDMASILPEGGVSSGRSLRARRAVNYRGYDDYEDEESDPASEADEEDDDDDDGDDDGDDDDEEGDDDDEEGETRGGDRFAGARDRKRRRLRVEQPTRASRRLRGSPDRHEMSDSDDKEDAEQQEEEDEAAEEENDDDDGGSDGDASD